MNELMNSYLKKTKQCVALELVCDDGPYVEDEGDLKVRAEYVAFCLQEAEAIWHKCHFSRELIVVYEDRYSDHNKGEKAFIESCLKPEAYFTESFKWQDEDESYKGIRYIWQTKDLAYKCLFKKIIESDLGEDTALDCAVYIIDQHNENVFFLYDDRGIDLYSSNDLIDIFNENK